MLRQLVRRSLMRLRRWLRAEESARSWGPRDSAYPWLNDQYLRILAKGLRVPRGNYIWGVLHGTYLAKVLQIPRVSVLELGVGTGRGLMALEDAAEHVEELLGVRVQVVVHLNEGQIGASVAA